MSSTYQAAPAATVDDPGFGGLVLYYEVFVPRHLKKKNGEPIGRRAAQIIAKENKLPLVRLGHTVFIDPIKAAERLRQAQIVDREEVRRPGRPKAGRT